MSARMDVKVENNKPVVCHPSDEELGIDADSSPSTTRQFMMSVRLSESALNCLLDGLYRVFLRDWRPTIDGSTPILGDYLVTRSSLVL